MDPAEWGSGLMIVYVAAPIDAVTHEDVASWPVRATEALLQAGAGAVFRPGLGWRVSGAGSPVVQHVNMTAIESADALLAFLPFETPSVGVPIEIYIACQRGIPVVVVLDRPRRSAVLDWLGVEQVVDPDGSGLCEAAALLVALHDEDRVLEGGA